MNSPEYTVKAPVIGPEIMCSGFVVCSRPASTNPQFATGPQKCVVFGPVGELMNFMSADDIAAAARVSDASARRELPRPRPEGALERRRGQFQRRRAGIRAAHTNNFDRQTRL